jgi:hypothetical protein
MKNFAGRTDSVYFIIHYQIIIYTLTEQIQLVAYDIRSISNIGISNIIKIF